MSYKTISLPRSLVDELDGLAADLELGFTSTAEAVKDAVRDKVLQYRRMKQSREAKSTPPEVPAQ